MSEFKPMLASPADLDTLRYPLLASPKLDGIRAIVRGGRLVSRKLLDIPNKHVQAAVLGMTDAVTGKLTGHHPLDGLDGELIVGEHDESVYRRTTSLVMSQDKPEIEGLCFRVFDHCEWHGDYYSRYDSLQDMIINGHCRGLPIQLVQQELIRGREALDEFEARVVDAGYEGAMLRDPNAKYKYGRSTAKEQILLKVKRFEDSEAVILRVEEEMHNANEALRDNLGRTKRSSAKDGKVGKGTMGALVVQDLKTDVEFNIGSGFTAADRQAEWKPGQIVKYKFFPVGVKDKPRHPVFIGRRSKIDL